MLRAHPIDIYHGSVGHGWHGRWMACWTKRYRTRRRRIMPRRIRCIRRLTVGDLPRDSCRHELVLLRLRISTTRLLCHVDGARRACGGSLRLLAEAIDLCWSSSLSHTHVISCFVSNLRDDPSAFVLSGQISRNIKDVIETSPNAISFFAHGESIYLDKYEQRIVVLLDSTSVPRPHA